MENTSLDQDEFALSGWFRVGLKDSFLATFKTFKKKTLINTIKNTTYIAAKFTFWRRKCMMNHNMHD